ncbi:uncharacterized protein TNCV_4179261 [Trichonephila clavipes]|nr:uncharacterized protein TNCV_4179261 [Trichonephila clavipes]
MGSPERGRKLLSFALLLRMFVFILKWENGSHSLKPFSHFKFDSNRIHFQTELLTRVCKRFDIPEFTSQRALKTIHDISHSVLKIYSDGSMGDCGISESGVHIVTPGSTFDIKIRNNNYCSVFRSKLIAIDMGLQFIDTASDLVFRDIWFLTDSRASIQHLSRWTTVRDMKSLNILDRGLTFF